MSLYVTPCEHEPRTVTANDPHLQPYADGYTAWLRGETDPDANPYRLFSVAAAHWREGWREAMRDYPEGYMPATQPSLAAALPWGLK